MWFWRRFFSFSVLTVSFGLGLGLGLEPLWTRTWLGLEPLWTWTWLGLEPLWTWTCLGLDKGGLDYSPNLQTRVTLKAFPIATPRGRSVSFPTRGTMVTYVTWDVFFQNIFYCVPKTNKACTGLEWHGDSWQHLHLGYSNPLNIAK